MVRDLDISVVMQGRFHAEYTPKCIEAVKRLLPRSELVLSINDDDDLSLLPASEVATVVLNDNPPLVDLEALWKEVYGQDCARACNHDVPRYTPNRQIVSTVRGIEASTRPYVLKVRVDVELHTLGFLECFELFPHRSQEGRVFSNRIVGVDIFHPVRSAFCMYLSDHCSFGTREDMLMLWDIPLIPSPQELPSRGYMPNLLIAEQYLFTSAINRRLHVYIPNMYYKDPELIEQSMQVFANNVITLSYHQFGFNLLKYPNQPVWNYTPNTPPWWERVSHGEWKLWYQKYCGSGTELVTPEEMAEVEAKDRAYKVYLQFLESIDRPAIGQYLDALYGMQHRDEFLEYGKSKGLS